MSKINKKSYITTGKNTSTVGLTAAIVKSENDNSNKVEAGICVLGDRGVVIIDEFDKMDDDNKNALLEVLE